MLVFIRRYEEVDENEKEITRELQALQAPCSSRLDRLTNADLEKVYSSPMSHENFIRYIIYEEANPFLWANRLLCFWLLQGDVKQNEDELGGR